MPKKSRTKEKSHAQEKKGVLKKERCANKSPTKENKKTCHGKKADISHTMSILGCVYLYTRMCVAPTGLRRFITNSSILVLADQDMLSATVINHYNIFTLTLTILI